MLGTYLALIAIFAWLYAGHVHSGANRLPVGYPQRLYFSGVTQATVGYGDLLPVDRTGRVLAVVQSLVGTTWIAVTTGLVAARLLLPDRRGVGFGATMIFNPIRHRFEVAVRTSNRGQMTRVQANLYWRDAGEPVSAGFDRTSVPYAIDEGEALLLRTPPVRLHQTDRGQWVPEYDVSPQPVDIRNGSALVAELGFTTPFGAEVFSSRSFGYNDVACGVYAQSQTKPVLTNEDAGLSDYCRHRCPFGLGCGLHNKVA